MRRSPCVIGFSWHPARRRAPTDGRWRCAWPRAREAPLGDRQRKAPALGVALERVQQAGPREAADIVLAKHLAAVPLREAADLFLDRDQVLGGEIAREGPGHVRGDPQALAVRGRLRER